MTRLKTVKLGKFRFSFANWLEFFILYSGIFLFRGYKFESEREDPFIIDCGSHIGMSILGFKRQYPKSKIIGFEPNPETFKILKKNVKQNCLKDVGLVNAAVGEKKGNIDFYINTGDSWSWGNSTFKFSWLMRKDFQKVKVKSVGLSQFINKNVDLLKLNIEGLETLVLREISNKLRYIKEMFLQYHGDSNNENNRLEDIFQILDTNLFEYSIKQIRRIGIPKAVSKSQIDRREPYWLIIHAKKKEK